MARGARSSDSCYIGLCACTWMTCKLAACSAFTGKQHIACVAVRTVALVSHSLKWCQLLHSSTDAYVDAARQARTSHQTAEKDNLYLKASTASRIASNVCLVRSLLLLMTTSGSQPFSCNICAVCIDPITCQPSLCCFVQSGNLPLIQHMSVVCV